MGHVRLGRLPNTRAWTAVVNLLDAGGDTGRIAAATISAAENSLAEAASDPAVRNAFWLLTQLPLAARSPDFLARLQELEVDIGPEPTLLTLTAGVDEAISTVVRKSRSKTDLGEMARLAVAETLTRTLLNELPGLLGSDVTDLRVALGRFSAPDRFSKLSRQFFASLLNRNLEYFISRSIADSIGPGRGFKSIGEHKNFRRALEQHCYEAARIVEVFSSDWYSKTIWQGGITPAKVSGFIHVAFKKLRDELRTAGADRA
jgi:hypothetical protein